MPIPEHYYCFSPPNHSDNSKPLEAYDISSHIDRYIASLEKIRRLPSMALYNELTKSSLSPQKIRVIHPETLNRVFKKHNLNQEKTDMILATVIKNLILLYERKNVHIAFEIPEIDWVEPTKDARKLSKGVKLVTTRADYQKEISKPSYQLAWGFISFFRKVSNMAVNKPLPISKFKLFNSFQLAVIGSKLGKDFSKLKFLGFDKHVHVFDFLNNFSSICKAYKKNNTTTFVFYGEHYADEKVLEKAHQKLIKTLKQSEYPDHIYIYLFSNTDHLKNISEIITQHQVDLPGVHQLHSLKTMEITYKNFQNLHRQLHKPKQYNKFTPQVTHESNAYIFYSERDAQTNYRESKKKLPCLALPKQVISHQVSIAQSTHQQQNQNQQQQFAKQTELRNTHALDTRSTTQLSVNTKEFWINWIPLEATLKKHVLEKAKLFLSNHQSTNPLSPDAKTFKTDFYQKNHSEWRFWTKILEDEDFRSQFVKRLCRRVSLSNYTRELCNPEISEGLSETDVQAFFSQNIQLETPHFFGFNQNFIDDLSHTGLYYLQDGINPKQCILNKLVMLIPDFVVGYQPSPIGVIFFGTMFDSLKLRQFSMPHAPFTWLSSACLVRNDSLQGLSHQDRQYITDISEKLLATFDSNLSPLESDLIHLETLYINLIEFYFPNHPEYHSLIRKLFACFDTHHSDYIKTLLFINLHGHTTYLERFLELLEILDKRALLPTFYLVFIKYAIDWYSIVSLLYEPKSHSFDNNFSAQMQSNPKQYMFDDLVKHTPVVNSPKQWPTFIKFYNSIFIYFAKNNIIYPHRIAFRMFSFYWEELTNKIEAHIQDRSVAEQLIEQLLNQLISESDGLKIQPVKLYETLFINLKKTLKNAIKHHCLEEQIMEISHLSFRWNDVPYALLNNDFKVVSKEMEVVDYKLNPFTARYYVSLQELKSFIFPPSNQNKSDKTSIFLTGVNFSYKTAAFRYLGGISLREPIDYYRQLYHSLTHRTDDPQERSLRTQIFAYYLLNSTGLSFRRPFDQSAFNKQFITLFSKKIKFCFKNDEKNALLLNIDALLEDFAVTLGAFQYEPKNELATKKQALWVLWRDKLCLNPEYQLPNCLTRTFAAHDICKYVYIHQEEICAFFRDTNLDPSACLNLLIQFIAQNESKNEPNQWIVQQCTTLLAIQYPDCTTQSFLQNIFEIERFIKAYAKQVLALQVDPFFDDLYVLCSNTDIRNISALLETFTETPAQHSPSEHAALHTVLLMLINQSNYLQNDLPNATQHVKNFLQLELRLDIKLEIATPLFQIFEKCRAQNGNQTSFKSLFDLCQTPQGRGLLSQINPLEPKHIHAVLTCLSDFNYSSHLMSFFSAFITYNPQENFEQIAKQLKPLTQTHLHELLSFHQWIVDETTEEIDPGCLINKLCNVKETALRKLSKTRDFIDLPPEKIVKHLFSERLHHKITDWQKQHVALNQNRFLLDYHDTKNKIAEMVFKVERETTLSDSLKDNLLIDYKNLMSYMKVNPVLTKPLDDGTCKALTISELDNDDFKFLFKKLSKKIQNSSTVTSHQYQIMLLALACEAMYRTVDKFPRNTQLLCLLMTVRHHGNLLHEVQTGEGKSIIAAMHAVLLTAKGHRVDVCTENDELANNAIKKFSDFYQLFEISFNEEVLTPDTRYKTYTQNTVTYSTPSNLSLFQLNIQLEKKLMPGNRVILADEIDAALTSPVEFRLSGMLKTEFYDTTAWHFVFHALLDFVQNNKIFLNNHCSIKDDLHNFRYFCHKKGANKAQKNLLHALDDKRLDKLIQSAIQAWHLSKNKNTRFYLVKKENDQQSVNYAAPIMDDTKRPNPAVNYGEFVQELLHALLAKETGAPFQEPQMAESIVSMSARNFFHNYARIIGLTGTSGSPDERQEFHNEYGLSVIAYPSFKPCKRTNLGLYVTEDFPRQQQQLFELICRTKQQNAQQPILIICESPKIVHKFSKFFKHQRPDWHIQSYDGYEQQGILEAEIVLRAGKNGVITIATQSMARGADVQPEHHGGLFVINTCTHITESELRQILGRAGRNGYQGLVCCVLGDPMFKDLSTPFETNALYLVNQKKISHERIQQRAENRLLQDLLYYFNQQFFTLRKKVDTLLEKPYGLGASLVSTRDFMEVLANFNDDSESLYKTHLAGSLSKEAFIESRVTQYNQIIKTWFDKAPIDLDDCEPAVPIGTLIHTKALYTYQIQDILPYSQICSELWHHFGHKDMAVGFDFLDTVVVDIKPYLDSEKSLFNTAMDFATTHQLINYKRLLSTISSLRAKSDLFFEEIIQVVNSYRLIGRILPIQKIQKGFESYLDHVKTLVEKKQWDHLSLPDFNFSTLKRMVSLINGASTLLGLVGGPIHFLIKRILVPAVKGILKQLFYHSESTLSQVLIGLDDIETHLSQCLSALYELCNANHLTLRHIVEKFLPILENKAFTNLVKNGLKLMNLEDYKHYIDALPELLSKLEPYYDYKFRILLRPQNIFKIFLTLSEVAFVKEHFNALRLESIVRQVASLDPAKTHRLLGKLSLIETVEVFKLLTHPHFNKLLQQLPQEMKIADLATFLKHEHFNTGPKDTSKAFGDFLKYQNNRARIAVNLNKAYHKLQNSTVTMKAVNHALSQNRSKTINLSPKATSSSNDNRFNANFYFHLGKALATALLVTYTVFCFSYLMLFASVVACGLTVFGLTKDLIKQHQAAKASDEYLMQQPAAPLDSFRSHNSKTLEAQENIVLETQETQGLKHPTPPPKAYKAPPAPSSKHSHRLFQPYDSQTTTLISIHHNAIMQ